MRKLCLSFILIASFVIVQAQPVARITNKVIASTGEDIHRGNFRLSYTIGETMVKTFAIGNNVLTQGFQQPDDKGIILTGSDLRVNTTTLKLDAFQEDGTGKLVLTSDTKLERGYLVLERLNNETGQYDAIEHRNVTTGNSESSTEIFRDMNPQGGDNVYQVKHVSVETGERKTDKRKLSFDEPIAMYPNPATTHVQVDLSSFIGKQVNIYIYSQVGRMMLQKRIEKVGKDLVNISLDGIVNGHYQMQIAVEGRSNISKKLIIAE
jgi:hypothetical protein